MCRNEINTAKGWRRETAFPSTGWQTTNKWWIEKGHKYKQEALWIVQCSRGVSYVFWLSFVVVAAYSFNAYSIGFCVIAFPYSQMSRFWMLTACCFSTALAPSSWMWIWWRITPAVEGAFRRYFSVSNKSFFRPTHTHTTHFRHTVLFPLVLPRLDVYCSQWQCETNVFVNPNARYKEIHLYIRCSGSSSCRPTRKSMSQQWHKSFGLNRTVITRQSVGGYKTKAIVCDPATQTNIF